MKILAIDAAGAQASVALWLEGELLELAATSEKGHGEQLLAMVDGLLAGPRLALSQLDAIAFGRGPGAFTGLRLAASIVQGLAWSTGLPVIPVSNLEAVAVQGLAAAAAAGRRAPERVLACQDARMGECYWAGYAVGGGALRPGGAEAVSAPARVLAAAAAWPRGEGAIACGSGLQSYPDLAAGLATAGLWCAPTLSAPAGTLARLAAGAGLAAAVPAEQAVPVYVRDDVARPAG